KPVSKAIRVRVANLASLPDDGVPRMFPVIVSERDDAWTRYHSEPIGSVFLRRQKGSNEVECFNASCPHAGCFVDFNKAKSEYQCPCHTSAFALDGKAIYGPSPRGLDSLFCAVIDREGTPEIIVEFEDFYSGIEEKK